MTAPMTSREALQDALDEWAMANLPTKSAGCIASWSDWIAAFVCDGVFGDSQMHPLSDIRDLDEVVRELGIQDGSTTPAEAVRELNAEIERLRSVAQAAPTREAIARIIAPQYFWQLDNTESGGRIYAAELETARSQADAIMALCSVPSTHEAPEGRPHPEVVAAVQEALMRHPHWNPGLGSSAFAFGLANTAIDAYRTAMTSKDRGGK